MPENAFISCEHLFKKYPGSDWIFKDATLTIFRNQFVFLLGSSGSGKTTFIKIMSGQEDYDRGKVFIEGVNFRKIKRKKLHLWRRSLGIVFQDFRLLLNETVKNNIALPLIILGCSRDEIDMRVKASLKLVQLEDKEDTVCKFLSGGEQQRVAIGRAIVHSPLLLLADEPTGNLDDKHTARILELFYTLYSKGITVIIATHDKRLPLAIPESRTVLIKDRGFVDVIPVPREKS